MNSTIGALTIGSDIYLPLRTVGEHHDTHVDECHLGILPIGSDASYHWECFMLGRCLGICTSLPWRGFVTNLLFGACVCIPFVSVVFCCLMQNGKFRFNSLRKILAMEL